MILLQYNEFLKAYAKEVLVGIIKADIPHSFSKPYANMYCQQFGKFEDVADLFEYAV